jgi:hypothetical protein
MLPLHMDRIGDYVYGLLQVVATVNHEGVTLPHPQTPTMTQQIIMTLEECSRGQRRLRV